MDPKSLWDNVYRSKAPDGVSWYAPHLEQSLACIQRTGLPPSASIIDVGGGEATLVDDLLDAKYEDVSVLDLSSKALEVSRTRLGVRASQVTWRQKTCCERRYPRIATTCGMTVPSSISSPTKATAKFMSRKW